MSRKDGGGSAEPDLGASLDAVELVPGASVETIPISALSAGDSPRRGGENIEHARVLAESGVPLPPIIVHRATMRVIDGVHRIRAAVLRGQRDVRVVFFDGDEKAAFVLAVRANIAHGLPLSYADRSHAAARIVRLHPDWSDRSVAAATGLSPKTVAGIRRRLTEEIPHSNTRVGRDGRIRPVSAQRGRRVAGALLADNPGATVREIARAAGISPSTAHDVRNRVRQGEDPALPTQRDAGRQRDNSGTDSIDVRPSVAARVVVLPDLRKDPSLRFTEVGRALLRLLELNVVSADEWGRLIDSVPPHCTGALAKVLRECADTWHYAAQRVERRAASEQRLSR